MENDYYKTLFIIKVTEEYWQFKNEMLLLPSEDVFANAYRIDIMINIYEILVELADNLNESEIRKLLAIHQLMNFLYEEWLKTEDDFYQQISESIKHTMEKEYKQVVIS